MCICRKIVKILQFQKIVCETVPIFEQEYTNSFGTSLEYFSLYNLSSGVSLHNEVSGNRIDKKIQQKIN